MLRVSIFTPSHDSKFLEEAYESIVNQPFYEWVILYNNGALPKGFSYRDTRVKEFTYSRFTNDIGLLKWEVCGICTGDILLELDHDDLLLPGAVEKVIQAFESDNSIGFVYSNAIHSDHDGRPATHYDEVYGWKYRSSVFPGLDEYVYFEPHPANVARIYFAPNHLRAFRRDVYEKVGGYDKSLKILDDEDIMCRLFLETKFYHLDEPLYIYRETGENSWLRFNKEIQDNVYQMYFKYIVSMACKWAKDCGLLVVDLGGRFERIPGFVSVDVKDADICADLNGVWPFEDGSVGVVRAFDIFEHLKDPLHTMKELYRVLCPGGMAFIRVPSTDGRGAFQDPTHCSFWNSNSFLYYTDARFSRYIDTPVRFQEIVKFTTPKNELEICWVEVHLVKLPSDVRVGGIISI